MLRLCVLPLQGAWPQASAGAIAALVDLSVAEVRQLLGQPDLASSGDSGHAGAELARRAADAFARVQAVLCLGERAPLLAPHEALCSMQGIRVADPISCMFPCTPAVLLRQDAAVLIPAALLAGDEGPLEPDSSAARDFGGVSAVLDAVSEEVQR
jgi:hypothetical protein